MPSEIKSATTDALRLRNYRTQLENHHEIELREIQERQKEEVRRLIDQQTTQLETLKNSYDVQISEEGESREEQLHQVRMQNSERVEEEKKALEDALIRQKKANDLKVEDARKNAEVQINRIRDELQANTTVLHEQARKSARREREV